MRVDTPTVPAHVWSLPNERRSASSGTSAVSCTAVASPRTRNASTVAVATRSTQAAPLAARPCCSTSFTSLVRSRVTYLLVHAAAMVDASPGPTTNSVRRMACTRISARRV